MLTSEKKFNFNDLFTFEMANNHQGSVAHGKQIIGAMGDIAKKYGIRAAVKFQFRDLDTFIHPDFINDTNNKHVSRFLSTRLSEEQFSELLNEVRLQGLLTMATPFDEVSVDMLEKLEVDIVKVASCSAKDWPLLSRIAKVDKPIIISTGGLTLKDIDNLVSFFGHREKDFALMHCVAIYPTLPDKLQLNQVALLSKRYPHITIGFSTHEEPDNYEAIQMAYAKGARIFERHVGVPTETVALNAYSSNPEQTARWVEAFKRAEISCGAAERLEPDPQEEKDLFSLMRGVFAKRNIKAGELLYGADVFFAIPIQPEQLTSGQFREGMVADKDYDSHQPLSGLLHDSTPTKKDIIYQAVHEVKGMLNEARIPIPPGDVFVVELSHHFGIQRFRETGVVIIDCINREYCKKILVQLPGQAHPMHYHSKKEEAFHMVSGELHAELDGQKCTIYPGDVMVIERGVKHSFWTETGAVFEEISTTHFNDDSFYDDPAIAGQERDKRKTRLINWGRHQFD